MSSYSTPFILRWSGAVGVSLCAQAAYAGVDASVTQQEVDYSGNTPLQLWQLGSDGRIYLYGGEGQDPAYCLDFRPTSPPNLNGTPLLLNTVIPSDATQVWDLASAAPLILNTGAALIGGGKYAMDSGGTPLFGRPVVIYIASAANFDQQWALEVLPSQVLAA